MNVGGFLMEKSVAKRNKRIMYFKLFWICIAALYVAEAEARVLRGTVKSAYGSVVPDIWVSVLGSGKAKTDATGEFEIDISSCINCLPGKTITLMVFNEEFGFHKLSETLNEDYSLLLEITRQPGKMGIVGTLKDSKSQKLLEGISVKILSAPYADKIPVVKTDQYGTFIIYLKKDLLGANQYLEMIFSDAEGRYMDKKETKNILAPFDVYMDKTSEVHNLQVNSLTKTDIHVNPGDVIFIKATGSIKVGPWVGHSGPNGRMSGVGGADLSFYNIIEDMNHAALMCRISGDNTWRFAGEELEFYAQSSGFLEFEVNDRDQANNSGAYQVKIILK
ncbi:MAG TPA: hypothetical protein DCG19_07180 [Cryomorphaceae bacterium]|nr:hypothetical protein [Owenweeksia sp.]MBF97735.1 hypothetical protein [Owenweeksia sp.]HAD97173.1 hypothetical protein [Cryomorphaceae bacterium]HBF21829.1 hypothetical protein [Cryomorphaceae bacterium]|tara:strand:+ start:16608 stop:17609 length:1002 start_codon:yes stop_codon:yes gene_type:complete